MTRDEFMGGWVMLTIQPWGRRYSGADPTGILQQEFYFRRLERYRADVWDVTADLFASGDHWPSVEEIRQAINSSLPARFQLTYEPDGQEKPELLLKIEAYRHLAIEKPVGPKTKTILDAAEAVVPAFEREHPGHEDLEPLMCRDGEFMTPHPAAWLIKKLRAFRAHWQVLQQEKRLTLGGQ